MTELFVGEPLASPGLLNMCIIKKLFDFLLAQMLKKLCKLWHGKVGDLIPW